MAYWQIALSELGLLGLAALFATGMWQRFELHREQKRWPVVRVTINGHKQLTMPKGTGTTIVGSHFADGLNGSFQFFWGPNTWERGRWAPPDDTPAIGASAEVRINPAPPRNVVRATLPSPVDVASTAVVLMLLSLAGLVLAFGRR